MAFADKGKILISIGVFEENIDNDSDDMDADAEPAINPLFFN